MQDFRIGLAINKQLGVDMLDQVSLFKDIGFYSFFTRWDNNVLKFRELAEKHGMVYQSVHAPNGNTQFLWENSEGTQVLISEWIECINGCADADVPIVVLHPFRGIDKIDVPNKHGVENFLPVVDAAVKRGIKIAVENCEGEEYLATLLNTFADCDNVGFCWDTGHELCYNRGFDMMERFGDRLICTHINDNFGVKDPLGKISSKDDLHLIPYDGIIDWESVKRRLNEKNYNDILTFEIKKSAYYDDISPEKFLSDVYERACRIASL